MVCDHNCVTIAGLIPASIRRVCSADRNPTSCSGEWVDADPSVKIFCIDDIEEPALARLNDCLMEEKALGVFRGLV